MLDDKYVKIVYQSEPIGKDKIVLYLTTFDFEAFERDENIKEPEKKVEKVVFDIPENDFEFMQHLEEKLDAYVKQYYGFYVEKIKTSKYLQENIINLDEITNKKQIIKGNVANANVVECEVIEGNVINCNNVRCNEIKGKMINCN